MRKKNLLLCLIFGFSILLSVSLSNDLDIELKLLDTPESSDPEDLDFHPWSTTSPSYNCYYDYIGCGIGIRSASGYVPTDVKVCFNNTNYTMTPIQMSFLGEPYQANATDYISYRYYFANPVDGASYKIKYYYGNSSGYLNSTEFTVVVDKECYTPSLSLSYCHLYANVYKIVVELSGNRCGDVENLVVTLDDVNYTLIDPYYPGTPGGSGLNTQNTLANIIPSSSTSSGYYTELFDASLSWTLIHNFTNDDEQTHWFNATALVNNQYITSYTQSLSTNIQNRITTASLDRPYDYFNIEGDIYTNNGINRTFCVHYLDSFNKTASEIKIEVNDSDSNIVINYTVNPEPNSYVLKYLNSPVMDCSEFLWTYGGCMGSYPFTESFVIPFEWNKTYALTVWVNNDTEWLNCSTMGPEIAIMPEEPPSSPFSIEILNSSIYNSFNYRRLNMTINITSSINGFSVNSNPLCYYQFSCYGPENIDSLYLYETEETDTNYIDGKTFSATDRFGTNMDDPWWGEITFGFYISWRNGTNLYENISPPAGEILLNTSDNEDAPIGTYGVEKGDVLNYDLKITSPSYCSNNEKTFDYSIAIVDIGQKQGSDYIDLSHDIKSTLYCCEDWWNLNYFSDFYAEDKVDPRFGTGMVRYFINPDYPQSYPIIGLQGFKEDLVSIFIIPIGEIDTLLDYLNGDDLKNIIRSGNTITYSYTAGDGSYDFEMVFNSQGILTRYYSSFKCNTYEKTIELNLKTSGGSGNGDGDGDGEGGGFIPGYSLDLLTFMILVGIGISVWKSKKKLRIS